MLSEAQFRSLIGLEIAHPGTELANLISVYDSIKLDDINFPSTVGVGLSPLTTRLGRRMRVSRTQHRFHEGTRHAEIVIPVGLGRLPHSSILGSAQASFDAKS